MDAICSTCGAPTQDGVYDRVTLAAMERALAECYAELELLASRLATHQAHLDDHRALERSAV